MARSDIPYSREGDENAWNKLIRDINEMAEECGLEPLDEVDECHRWAKQDVTEAQDKIIEACPDNSFTPVKDTWSKLIVQELEDAIANGACCCEDIYENGPREDDGGGEGPGGGGDCEGTLADPCPSSQVGSIGWHDRGITWRAVFMGAPGVNIFNVSCFDEEGNETFIENRSGGFGWVGRQFDTWEATVWWDLFEPQPSSPTFTGPIVDGYIELPGFPVATQPTCDNPSYGSGWKGGEENPAWPWGFGLETDETNTNDNPFVYAGRTDFWPPLNRGDMETLEEWIERHGAFIEKITLKVTVTWNDGDDSSEQTFPAQLIEDAFDDSDIVSPLQFYEFSDSAIDAFVKSVLQPLGVYWVDGIGDALEAGEAFINGPSLGVVFRCRGGS